MKKSSFKNHLFEKAAVLLIIATLIINVIPQFVSDMLMAERENRAVLTLTDENTNAKRLSVSTNEPSYTNAILLKDDTEISRSSLSPEKEAVFYIQINGTYTIQITDAQDEVVETQTQVISGYSDLKIEAVPDSDALKITGRGKDVDHFIVTFNDTKQQVPVTLQDQNVYYGEYTPAANGTYIFQCADHNEKEIGEKLSYEVTTIKDTPKTMEKPKEAVEVHINNEAELKQISNDPDGIYILDRDIYITDKTSRVLVETFSGELRGNGFQIQNLSQPLFGAVSNAKISDLSLQGKWENKEGALLAINSENAAYTHIAVNAELSSKGDIAGMLLHANNDVITKSYVSGMIEGNQASGFVFDGKTTITDSYVSGLIKATKKAAGFSEDAAIKNSYVSASVTGETMLLFNRAENTLENAVYDIDLQEIEEERAAAYTSEQFTNGVTKPGEAFKGNKGSYPSIISETAWSKASAKSEALSLLALPLTENIHGITQDVSLPEKLGNEELEWSQKGNSKVANNTLIADVQKTEKDTSGYLMVKSKAGMKSYASASARTITKSPIAGEALAEEKTSISFNATERVYYKVALKTDTVAAPATHKEAIANGWKRYLWNGVINWSGLEWNTDYVLYEYDMVHGGTLTKTDIQTNQGLIGGSVTLSSDTSVGATVTATLGDDALITKGSWTWEKSRSLSAATWKPIASKNSVDTDSKTSSYVPVSEDAGYYLRATFTVSDGLDFKGSVPGISDNVVTESLTKVSIYNAEENEITSTDMVVGTLLHAQAEPVKLESGVAYYWYHEGDETIQGTGKEYNLSGKDVNKKLYVKAMAKSDGGASGEVTSAHSELVRKAKTTRPAERPEVVSAETTDISVTVKLPDTVHEGLYQFGYIEHGSGATEPHGFEIYTRANNPVTITGLKPNTTYSIYVKKIGENGYEDSDWGTSYASVITENEHLKGTVIIKNSPIYGETLQASVENGNPSQTHDIEWYRVSADGTISTTPIGSGPNYPIKSDKDIGKKLRVIYKGNGVYAGQISADTDVVKKAEVHAPYNALSTDTSVAVSDTEIEVEFPALDNADGALGKSEKFILGYSKTEGGVPIEYREGEGENRKVVEFTAGDTKILKGFTHNTKYYFFLRYAETLTHYKSDWSSIDNSIAITTEKTAFNGTLQFEYTSDDKAVQGEKLSVRLDGATTEEGTWSWTKIGKDGSRTEIKNYFPEEGRAATYIIIPNDAEAVGTKYEVTFTPGIDYSGSTSATSNVVEKSQKEKYPIPDAAGLTATKPTDTTLTFQMKEGTDGAIYQFKYGETDDITKALPVDIKSYKGTDVTITGLDRNKDYYIWVSQAGDNVKDDSDYSTSSLKMHTEKTDIHGYVTIEETPVVNVALKAKYVQASYIPEGNDKTDGTWQWYRKDGESFTRITGATTDTYTPATADIGKELRATFTGGGDFKDSKSAVSEKTKKPPVVDPTVTLTQIADVDGYLTVQGALDTSDVWYRLQLHSEDEPELPSGYSNTDMTNAKWTKATTNTLKLNKDYKNAYLTPRTSYTIYIVKAETDTAQASNIISGTVEIGELTQRGTIAISGNPVVGKELTATLKDHNNTSGTWKWYVSTTDCGDGSTAAPSLTDTSKWEQLSSGYYPSVNSATSTLTISEKMFTKYIKAEFVANETQFYKGTIKSNASDYIRKIYDETLTLSSSTKDGNGDPKAYAGTVLTGTINNYAESGALNTTRTKVTFNVNTSTETIINPTAFKVDADANTASFTYTLPENTAFDTKTISATVSKPKKYKLYVDKDLNALTNTDLKSGDTNSNFSYTYGIPISTKEDMKNFTASRGNYSSDSATYVITDNIDMTDVGRRSGYFAGTLNGDYHYLTYSNDALFTNILGASASNRAVIKNIIFSNSNVDGENIAILGINAGNADIEELLLVDANLTTSRDSGMFLSLTQLEDGDVNISKSGAAHGIFTESSPGKSVGGFIGIARDPTKFSNFLSVDCVMNVTTNSVAGGITRGGGTFKYGYSSNNITAPADVQKIAGVTATVPGSGSTNAFWDKTVLTNSTVDDTPGQIDGKTTKQMTGDGLKPYFEVSGNEGNWVYSEGFYPMLKWTVDKNVEGAVLYAATRGAFVSLDGNTSQDELYNGFIKGAIKVPKELQKSGYSYSSTDGKVLKVTDGGTIIPVGEINEKASVIVTYKDKNTGAQPSATYEFTIGRKVSALSSVTVSGNTHPGQVLTASVSPSTSVTYQWYKRAQGTSDRKAISGATTNKYTITPDDIGSEINVDVKAYGYATASNYTAAITSVAPAGIDVKAKTDTSITVMAKGVSGANYEYAYATTNNGKKTIVGQSKDPLKISGLTRNTEYWVYARVAGADDGSYEASPWSNVQSARTEKTEIAGEIAINSNVNMGQTLSAVMPDTNLQTGTWKMERIDSGGNVTGTLTPAAADTYNLTYVLKKEDAGSRIRISFIASGNFKDPGSGAVKVETKELLLQSQTPPTSPADVDAGKQDHQIQIKETDSEAGTLYEFGYRKDLKAAIIPIDGTYAANAVATITGLERNTTYYLYARKAKKDSYEASPWSPAIQITTKKTDIASSTITFNGMAKVDQSVTFTVDNADANVKGQEGLWVLERIGDGKTNTLLGTTSADTHTYTYTIVPEDSGYSLKATYIARGDYENSVTYTTPAPVVNNSQSIGSTVADIDDDKVKVYTIGAYIKNTSTDIFEFGYRKAGDTGAITPYKVTATWGNVVDIGPLDRATTYDIFVRKAKKTGYDESTWSNPVTKTTKKEQLSGNITYTGSTAVGDTITAVYEQGIYEYAGDDTTGTWQWYLDDTAVEGAVNDTFAIVPTSGNPKVSVKYTAADGSGFSGVIERKLGTVYKPAYAVPSAAKVTAGNEDNTKEGSTLHVQNTEIDNVYIYLHTAEEDVLPETVTADSVIRGNEDNLDNLDRWIKAEAEMDIRVPANKSYIVYSARLESDTNVASEISSARGVLSAKEPLSASAIEEQNTDVAWKALQSKTLQYSVWGKAPSGTWKYYVHDPAESGNIWQNIDTELMELGRVDEVKDNKAMSTITIPLKYKGFEVKAVFSGNDDYSQSVEFITPAIEGKLIDTTGAQIIKSDKTQLLDTLTANYISNDDKNGSFTWYRRANDGSETKILTDSPNTTSKYQLLAEDLGYHVYAVYNAAPNSLYSGKAVTDSVYVTSKATQNTPDKVKVLQVNGNSIQLEAPSNYNRNMIDAIPQVVLGYQETDEAGTPKNPSAITWQMEGAYGDNWFKKLNKNSYYVVYAKFLGTEVYAPSAISPASEVVKTENELFNEKNLKLEDKDILGASNDITDVGNALHISFTGEGYDEGSFSLKRSNGEEITAKVTEGLTSDADTKTISFDYTYQPEDVGSTIIVSYTALDSAIRFDGTISASSRKAVTKPKATETAVQPTLERGLDTNLLTKLSDGYEYYLSESDSTPEEGDWDVLDENNPDKAGYHDFRGLERLKEYYLHARIAETKENRASEEVVSTSLSPEPFINTGDVTVRNTKDLDRPALAETALIDFPYTLNTGTLEITSMTLKREQEPDKVLNLLNTDQFVNADGTANRQIFEKGSSWANENFACDLIVYSDDGTSVIAQSHGEKTSMTTSGAKKLGLRFYRGNAVSLGGTFTWQAYVKDAEGNEALLQSKVTMETDISAVQPIKIDLNLKDGKYIKQSSNTARLKNDSYMPIEISAGRKAEAGTDVPDAGGIYTGSEPAEGSVYLKMSNDGSNYTSRWNGVWFTSTADAAQKSVLMRLGHEAGSGYYVTGIANENQSWPWPSDGSRVISQAYKFRFITEISKDEIKLDTLEKPVFKEAE